MLLAIWYDLLQHKCTGWHYKTLGQQLWEQPPTQGSLAKLLSDVTQQCHHKTTLHKLSPYTLPTMARPNTTHHHHNLATAPSYRTSYALLKIGCSITPNVWCYRYTHLKGCSISPRGALSNPTRGTDTPTPREWSTKHPWVFHNPSTVFNMIVQKVEQWFENHLACCKITLG